MFHMTFLCTKTCLRSIISSSQVTSSNNILFLTDDEENLDNNDQNGSINNKEDSAIPSTSSTGQHEEIDAKLADFFKVRLVPEKLKLPKKFLDV